METKVRAWLPLDLIEPRAREQIENLSKVPGLHRWLAIMPDVHPGFGMPIGGVAALDGYIIPNAVGVDIGCGILALKLSKNIDQHSLPELLQDILKNIPVGFNKRKTPLDSKQWTDVPELGILHQHKNNARLQLGTLGGGNHFVEIQRDQEGHTWLMLHSGSRNLGNQVADYYNKCAQKELNAQNVDFPQGLAWLETSSTLGQEYLLAMNFCLEYARENRRMMADICLQTLSRRLPGCHSLEQIETIHNYAKTETHFDKEVIVHRKGAVLASGKVVIPGSMGTASYIGQGLEHPESFKSCSHGAGRLLGRKEAKSKLNKNDVLAGLKRRGIVLVTPDKAAVIEEADAAYKNIEEVMAYQRELVTPVLRLQPLGVIKG